MACPTLGKPKSLYFQVRTDCKHVSVLTLLGHDAGLILSPNGVFHRLLQASGSTAWEGWSDQIC